MCVSHHALRQTPRSVDGYCWGLYASYWNAFFFLAKILQNYNLRYPFGKSWFGLLIECLATFFFLCKKFQLLLENHTKWKIINIKLNSITLWCKLPKYCLEFHKAPIENKHFFSVHWSLALSRVVAWFPGLHGGSGWRHLAEPGCGSWRLWDSGKPNRDGSRQGCHPKKIACQVLSRRTQKLSDFPYLPNVTWWKFHYLIWQQHIALQNQKKWRHQKPNQLYWEMHNTKTLMGKNRNSIAHLYSLDRLLFKGSQCRLEVGVICWVIKYCYHWLLIHIIILQNICCNYLSYCWLFRISLDNLIDGWERLWA